MRMCTIPPKISGYPSPSLIHVGKPIHYKLYYTLVITIANLNMKKIANH